MAGPAVSNPYGSRRRALPRGPAERLSGAEKAELAQRLRAARQRAAVSQARVAAALGCWAQTVQGWEAGRSSPNPSLLTELAGLYGVSAEWLRTGRGDAGTAAEGLQPAPTGVTLRPDPEPIPGPPQAFVGEDVSGRFVLCPACGARGLRVRELPEHLAGGACSRRHVDADVRALVPGAQTDTGPWLQAIAECEASAAEIEAHAKKARGPLRRSLKAAASLCHTQREKLLRMGPERYRRTT